MSSLIPGFITTISSFFKNQQPADSQPPENEIKQDLVGGDFDGQALAHIHGNNNNNTNQQKTTLDVEVIGVATGVNQQSEAASQDSLGSSQPSLEPASQPSLPSPETEASTQSLPQGDYVDDDDDNEYVSISIPAAPTIDVTYVTPKEPLIIETQIINNTESPPLPLPPSSPLSVIPEENDEIESVVPPSPTDTNQIPPIQPGDEQEEEEEEEEEERKEHRTNDTEDAMEISKEHPPDIIMPHEIDEVTPEHVSVNEEVEEQTEEKLAARQTEEGQDVATPEQANDQVMDTTEENSDSKIDTDAIQSTPVVAQPQIRPQRRTRVTRRKQSSASSSKSSSDRITRTGKAIDDPLASDLYGINPFPPLSTITRHTKLYGIDAVGRKYYDPSAIPFCAQWLAEQKQKSTFYNGDTLLLVRTPAKMSSRHEIIPWPEERELLVIERKTLTAKGYISRKKINKDDPANSPYWSGVVVNAGWELPQHTRNRQTNFVHLRNYGPHHHHHQSISLHHE